MGCWNETCGITNLPILLNDDVVVIVIRENEKYPGTISSKKYGSVCDEWSPVGLPIFGKYNDYGGVFKINKDEFYNDLFEELNYSNKNFSFENFKDEYNFSTFFVHKEIYDSLISENINYKKIASEKFQEEMQKTNNHLQKITDNETKAFFYEFYLESSMNVLFETSGMRYNTLLKDKIKNSIISNECIDKTLIDRFCELSCFILVCQDLRKMLYPQNALSQNDNTKNHKLINKVSNKIIKNIEKRFK